MKFEQILCLPPGGRGTTEVVEGARATFNLLQFRSMCKKYGLSFYNIFRFSFTVVAFGKNILYCETV